MHDQFDTDDTIVAQATAREPGFPRGILRISGPRTGEILRPSFQATTGIDLAELRVPTMLPGCFRCDTLSTGVPVEVLFWPTLRSYTRQVSAEIHAIGSLPILDAIVQQLCDNGARLAKPGEFTLRAFLSGRLDLTEAEAVLGVIDAQDQRQLDVALNQLGGGLSRPLHQSRQDLLMILAHLEAGLDFVEEDIEFVTDDQVLRQVEHCLAELERLKLRLQQRQQSESGYRLVLFGRPNTGKSSLFNQLVERFGQGGESAIVSDVSGTTRDFITAALTLGDLELELVDTAGLDALVFESSGEAPAVLSPLVQGQRQSTQQEKQASLTLFCLDASQPIHDDERRILAQAGAERIVCLNKWDLVSTADAAKLEQVITDSPADGEPVRLSSRTGEGLEELAQRVREMVNRRAGESLPSTAVRCAATVDDAMTALGTARELVVHQAGDELVAAEIRAALEAIGQITGVVYTDDILDVVFKQFCIGK